MNPDSLPTLLVAIGNATIGANGKRIQPYGYTPTQYVCYLYIVLFTISGLIHIGQAVRYRAWFTLYTATLCAVGEVIGWAGRLWNSYDMTSHTAFTIQIVCTIVSPTFLIAANFIVLGTIIERLGVQYSRLRPNLYKWIFLSCDVISLIVQALGGAKASVADDLDGKKLGSNIMLAGIVFQLVSIIIYTGLATEFLVRYIVRRPISGRIQSGAPEFVPLAPETNLIGTDADAEGRKVRAEALQGHALARVRLMGVALGFSTILILIRSIYRTVELADGWGGVIITTEVYFNVLDAAMIMLAIYTMNALHPGRLLR